MKAKKMMAAMMLPALLAACTQDEIGVPSESPENINGRKLVENVSINFTRGADTRLDYDGSWHWRGGDKIGALLVDEITDDYDDPAKEWYERFRLTDYIHTNYPFTKTGEETANRWEAPAGLQEGNYFFVYPYDKNQKARSAYEFDLGEQVQTGGTEADANGVVAVNNAFIGFSKIDQEVRDIETLTVSMTNVFGATKFVLNNTGTNTYKIERLVLRGKKVTGNATLDPTHTTVSKQYSQSMFGKVKDKDFVDVNSTSYTNYGTDKDSKTAGFNVDQAMEEGYMYDSEWKENGYNLYEALRDAVKYDFDTTNGKEISVKVEGVSLKSQETAYVMVMSAMEDITAANNDDAILDIYTDRGIIKGINLNEKHTISATPTTGVNVTTDKKLGALGKTDADGGKARVDIIFDDTSVDQMEYANVKSDADLEALIQWNVRTSGKVIAILEKDVNFTKQAYDYLKSNPDLTVVIVDGTNTPNNHTLTIDKDVPADVLKQVEFGNSSTPKPSVLTTSLYNIKNVVVTGTVDLAKDVRNAEYFIITEDAVVNVTGESVVYRFTNEEGGTLNVKATLRMTGGLDNWGKITVGREGKINNSTGMQNKPGAELENNGTIAKVASNAEAKNGKDAAVIRNYGTINEVTTNSGKIYNSSHDSIPVSDRSVLNVTDNEAGGEIYMYGKAGAIIGENKTNANVIVTEMDTDAQRLNITTKNGNVVQEVTGAENINARDFLKVDVNTLWIRAEGSLNLSGGSSTGDVDWSTGTEVSVVVKEGVTTSITGTGVTGETLKLKALTMEGNTELTIGKLKEISAGGPVTYKEVDAEHPAKITINGTVGKATSTDFAENGAGTTVINYAQKQS